MSLFKHAERPHQTQDANILHELEKLTAGLNQRIAIKLTMFMSAMPTFWGISAFIVLWVLSNATIVHFDPVPWPILLALANVPQLPLMCVLAVGQDQLGRHQQIMAEEAFKTTENSYHDIEQIIKHLDMQDEQILEILHRLEAKS